MSGGQLRQLHANVLLTFKRYQMTFSACWYVRRQSGKRPRFASKDHKAEASEGKWIDVESWKLQRISPFHELLWYFIYRSGHQLAIGEDRSRNFGNGRSKRGGSRSENRGRWSRINRSYWIVYCYWNAPLMCLQSLLAKRCFTSGINPKHPILKYIMSY